MTKEETFNYSQKLVKKTRAGNKDKGTQYQQHITCGKLQSWLLLGNY